MQKIFLYWLSGIVLIFFFLLQTLAQFPDGRIHIFFLDVGQGDAILIRTPRGQNILIDSGPSKNILKAFSKTSALQGILPFFNRRIDLAIVTHFEKDHAEGFLEMFDRYEIKKFLISGALRGSNLEKEFFQKIKEKKIPIQLVSSNRDLQIAENLYLDFLYPFQGKYDLIGKNKSLNETSVTFRLVRCTKRSEAHANSNLRSKGIECAEGKQIPLLYSGGDSGFALEEMLIKNRLDLSAKILKVSHHGSRYSTGEKFLQLINPQTAVISSSRKNSYGHPHEDTLSRLSRTGTAIRRTDLEGTVEAVF